ncbi:hypothetical protein MMC28_011377 [Mycoblastus sanguinarius]|nr:hypothetical protein [Mycoblastus sanguinarius]
MCEKEYADHEAGGDNIIQQPPQELRPQSLNGAMRQGWRRTGPKPLIKVNRRSQPVFNLQASNDYVGAAKRFVAKLNDYEAQFKPMLDAVNQAREARYSGHYSELSGAPTPISSSFLASRQGEREANYDPSRDPRVR